MLENLLASSMIQWAGLIIILLLGVVMLFLIALIVMVIFQHFVKVCYIVYVSGELHKRFPDEQYMHKSLMSNKYWKAIVFYQVFFSWNFFLTTGSSKITNPRMTLDFDSSWPSLIWIGIEVE